MPLLGGMWWYIWQNSGLTHRLMTCDADYSSNTLDHLMPLLKVGVPGADRGVGVLGCIGGYIWKMKMVCCKVLLKTQDSLLQTIEHELRSTGPKFLPLLATRCLSLGALRGMWENGGVHLTKHQCDPQADDMSCWPIVVPLLTTRCLHWGWGHLGLSGGVGGVREALGVTYDKWRQSIAKYSWKLKMVYCR